MTNYERLLRDYTELHVDFIQLAKYYDDAFSGGEYMEEAQELLRKYHLVDKDGFWIGEE